MIDNGSRCVTVITDDQEFKHINFRVTGVHKALASISAICDRDQRVVFDNDGCYILDKHTAQAFERDNDVYHLNVQVPKPQHSPECKPLAPVDKFSNSGAKAAKRSDFARLAQFLP